MNRNDVVLFVEDGVEYKFIESNNDVTIGTILKMSDTAMVIQRDNGKKKIISFETLQGIDECTDEKEFVKEKSSSSKEVVCGENFKIDELPECSSEFNIYVTDAENIELSSYLSSIIDNVELGKYQEQGLIEKDKIVNGRYVGNGKMAMDDIAKLKEALRRKNTKEYSGEYYLAMTRIAYDSLAHSPVEKLSKDYIFSLLGVALIEKGDFTIAQGKSIDTAISYYIEALKILPETEKKYIYKSMNMLVYAFFADAQDLQKEIVEKNVSKELCMDKYYTQIFKSQNNIREFVIATFMLYEKKPKFVAMIKDTIVANKQLKDYVIIEFARIQQVDRSELDKDFDDAWKGAYDEYTEKMTELHDAFGFCVKEFELEDQLKKHRMQIEDIQKQELLFGIDDDNVKDFMETIDDLCDIRKKVDVSERIDSYRKLYRHIEGRLVKLVTSPSEWSYAALRDPDQQLINMVHDEIVNQCNSSKPEIVLEIQKNEILVNEKAVTVEIEVKNMKQKQRADAIDIEVTCADSEIRVEELNRCGAIEAGEQESYCASYQLTDNIIKRGNFQINVKLVYTYFVNFMTMRTDEINQSFVIKFINKPYQIIEPNRYHSLVNSTGVSDPDMFKGRSELINKLCNAMHLGNGKMNTNRGIVLWGQRRVGKNSVKDNFKKQLKVQYPEAYIHIDIGSIGKVQINTSGQDGKQSPFKNLLLIIARNTENEIRRNHKELYKYYENAGLRELNKEIRNDENYVVAFEEYMSELMHVIGEHSKPNTNIPLYYIDEFTYCYEWIMEGKVDGKEFMQFIKSFISDYGICAILLAQDNMPVWKAEYPNEFNCMDFDNMISFLDRAGTAELVCEPCPINGKSRFMPDAVEYIYDLTRGSAYLIVILCDQIIEYLNEMKTEEYVKKYTVENVLGRWISGERNFFEESVFEAQYQDTSKVGEEAKKAESANKELLLEIAENTRERETVNIGDLHFFENHDKAFAQDIYERLVKRKIIVEDGEKCKIYMPLLKFMFLKKRGLLDEDALEYVD